MGAGGERCVFAASHWADLPLLLARPGLALLSNKTNPAFFLPSSPCTVMHILWVFASSIRTETVAGLLMRFDAWRPGEVRTAVAARTPMTAG